MRVLTGHLPAGPRRAEVTDAGGEQGADAAAGLRRTAGSGPATLTPPCRAPAAPSSGGPEATSRPASSTWTASAPSRVDRRWAIRISVRRPDSAAQRPHHRALRLVVEGRGRLVEHDHVRVVVERPGDADALALAARQPRAALADPLAVAVRQGRDEVVGAGEPRRPLDGGEVRRSRPSAMFSATVPSTRNTSCGHVADPVLPRGQGVGVEGAPVHGDPARARAQHAEDAGPPGSTCPSRCGRRARPWC